jgi:hypothetical protein
MKVSGQFHAPAGLPTVPIAEEAGWAPGRSGRCGEEKKKPCPCRNPTAVVHPVA